MSSLPEQFLETDQEFQYDSDDDDDQLEDDEDLHDEDDDHQDEHFSLDEGHAEQQAEEGDEYWAQEQADYDDEEPEQFENALLDDDFDNEIDNEWFDDSVYFDEAAADRDDFDDMVIEDETLSGSALQSAVDYNQKYAAALGWLPYFDNIVQSILKLSYSPDAHAFAEAVAAWQDRSGLGFDGKIGPSTWKHMKALLGIGSAPKPARPSSGKKPSSLISTQMPPSSSGQYVVNVARRAYGLPETISALKWIGNQWHKHTS